MLKNKYAVISSRILVGALFIVSGLIKANDPLGFSYKLEEYFAEDVLNWTLFHGWEIAISSIVSIVEIILGIAVIAGEKFKLSAWVLLLMMVFFTFLTGYTALGNWFFENPETGTTSFFEGIFGFEARNIHYFSDCGCFGDALKLTPFQSFVKDLILLIFTVILFINRNNVVPNTRREDLIYYGVSILMVLIFSTGVIGWFFPMIFSLLIFVVLTVMRIFIRNSQARGFIFLAVAALITSVFTYYTYAHLPVKDFRPYAVGKNIEEGMTIPEGKNPPKYGYIYTLENSETGKTMNIRSDEYLEKEIWKDEAWEITETGDQILIEEGYEPPIHDFVLESPEDGGDYTSYLLGLEKVIVWVQYDIKKSSTRNMDDIRSLSEEAQQQGYEIFGLTSSSAEQIEEFRHEHQLAFPYLQGDATMLKTIVRSNPGLVVLHSGTVMGKWHHNDIVNLKQLKKTTDKVGI